MSKEDKFNNLLKIVIHKKITLKELFSFNYKKDYPKSRREKEIENLKLIQDALGEFATVTLR